MQHCKKFGIEVFIVSEHWFKVTPRTVCPQSNCLTKFVSKVKHIVKLSFIDIILLIFSTKRLSLEACFIKSEPHKMWVRSFLKYDPKKSIKIFVAIFFYIQSVFTIMYNTHIRLDAILHHKFKTESKKLILAFGHVMYLKFWIGWHRHYYINHSSSQLCLKKKAERKWQS